MMSNLGANYNRREFPESFIIEMILILRFFSSTTRRTPAAPGDPGSGILNQMKSV